jgi:hypothetical protein
MTDQTLIRRVVDVARELSARDAGAVDGRDVSRHLGRGDDDEEIAQALRAAHDRGELECREWRGVGGLPCIVRMPPVA